MRHIVNKYLRLLKRKVKEVPDVVDGKIFPKLILSYKLRTHDAILLTTAIAEKCSWFVTNDMEIIELGKGRGNLLQVFGIAPDLPENFLKVIK